VGAEILLDGGGAGFGQVGLEAGDDAAVATHQCGEQKVVLVGEVVVEHAVRDAAGPGDVTGGDGRHLTLGQARSWRTTPSTSAIHASATAMAPERSGASTCRPQRLVVSGAFLTPESRG